MENKEKARFAYKPVKGITDEEILGMIRMVNENSCNWELKANDEPRYESVNRAELKWCAASNIDEFINILLVNDYKVTMYFKGELSDEIPFDEKPDKIAVIEFEKVER